MTAVALLQCSHIEAGTTHTYIERLRPHPRRYCLDCAAELFVQTQDPRLQAIYLQVVEAREQKRARARLH